MASVEDTLSVRIGTHRYTMDLEQYLRQPANSNRTSSDEGGDTFERSTSDEQLWKRTGYDWSQGAGQDWWDRRESERRRFKDSLGVYPWDEGKLSLYGGAESEGESGVTEMLVAGGYLYLLLASSVRRLATASGSFSTVSGGGACSSITTDGNKVWTATGTDIETFTGTGSASTYSTFNAYLVGYANGRLLATDNAAKGAIYEITDGGSTSTLIWTHPNSAFEWKRIVHAPNGVYLVGDAGTQSEVYKMTVADSTGALVPPFPAVQMEDEVINDLVHYGGLFLGSTDRGFRLFNIADASGHLTYGKVIEFGGNPGGGIATRGEDVYVGWGGKTYTKADASTVVASGVAHVRLTEFTETLVPPYAFGPGYRSGATDDVVAAVAYFKDQIFWTVDGALYSDQANPADGFLNIGEIEFGVIDEPKRLVNGAVRHEALPSGTTVQLKLVEVDGTVVSAVYSVTGSATSASEEIEETVGVGERWTGHLELVASGATSPVLERWTVTAIPQPKVAEDILLPIMLVERVEDEVTGADYGLDVWEEYSYLKGLAASKALIDVYIGVEQMRCVVQGVSVNQGQIQQWTGPTVEGEYLQGTYYVQLRTVDLV